MSKWDVSEWGKPPPYRSTTDLTANNHLASYEREIEGLKRQISEQADEIKAIAWMCKECQSTFPSMLVRTSITGEMICPRCSSTNKIARAHEAIPIIMKEKVQRLQAFEDENKCLKAEIKRLGTVISALTDEINRYRVRFQGGGRVVEGEP